MIIVYYEMDQMIIVYYEMDQPLTTYLHPHRFQLHIRPVVLPSTFPRTSIQSLCSAWYRTDPWSPASTHPDRASDPCARLPARAAYPAATDPRSSSRSSTCTPRWLRNRTAMTPRTPPAPWVPYRFRDRGTCPRATFPCSCPHRRSRTCLRWSSGERVCGNPR